MSVLRRFLLVILLLSSVISLSSKTGTIYKIQCQITGKIFIGRTAIGIEKALLSNSKNYDQYKRGHYKTDDRIFEVVSSKDYNVTILEIVPHLANDTDFSLKLRKLQRYYVEQYGNVVNKIVPSRTFKEYCVANREHRIQLCKKYREDHREAVLNYQKERYESHLAQKVV